MTDVLDRRAPETTHVPAALSSPEVSTVAALLGLLPNCKVVYALRWLGLSMVQGSVVSESMPVSLTASPWSPRQPCTSWRALVALGARKVCVGKGTPESRTGGLPQRTLRTTGRSGAMRFRSNAPDACCYATRSDARLTDPKQLAYRGSSAARPELRARLRRRNRPAARPGHEPTTSGAPLAGACSEPGDSRLALDASRGQRAQMRFGTVVVERYG